MKAFLFPGQGSQSIAMGFDFYNEYETSRNIFEKANNLLKFKLTDLIFSGTESELKRTKNSQIAIATTSIAILEVLKEKNLFNINSNENFTAGHSLGEYVSLYYADILSFEDTINLLHNRGRIMDELQIDESGMASVLGLSESILDKIMEEFKSNLSEHEVLEIANFNAKTQIVLSGHLSAINKFKIYISENNIPCKLIFLEVEKAFHSSLMNEAKVKFEKFIKDTTFKPATKNIILNATGKLAKDNQEIKEMLLENLIKGVKWQQSMVNLIYYGIRDFYSIGNGNALTNMLKRDEQNINTIAINSVKAI